MVKNNQATIFFQNAATYTPDYSPTPPGTARRIGQHVYATNVTLRTAAAAVAPTTTRLPPIIHEEEEEQDPFVRKR